MIRSKIQIFWNLTSHLQYIEAIAEGLSTIPLKFKKENVVKNLKCDNVKNLWSVYKITHLCTIAICSIYRELSLKIAMFFGLGMLCDLTVVNLFFALHMHYALSVTQYSLEAPTGLHVLYCSSVGSMHNVNLSISCHTFCTFWYFALGTQTVQGFEKINYLHIFPFIISCCSEDKSRQISAWTSENWTGFVRD